MKKTISILLTLALLLSVFPIGAYAADQTAFTDVKAADWFYDDVTWATENGIMAGISEKEFAPKAATDRATLVLALYHLERDPYNLWKNYFTDVDVEEAYAPAVAWAAGNGIVNGFTDGTFRPNEPITREQLAAMIYRYVQYRGDGFTGAWAFPLQYDDARSVSDWAYESLCWCTMKKIVQGTSDTMLTPKGGATRGQLAAMLRRLTETYTQTLTRADLENAAIAAAWAYYFKFEKMQYDSISINDVPKYLGGSYRGTENVAPEYGTEDTIAYSVCSDYANKSWYNGTGIRTLGEPLDAMTASMWEEGEANGILVYRWIREDYKLSDRDKKMGIDPASPLAHGTEEMRTILKDWRNTLRPGDIFATSGHTLLYVGNGYVIDCWGAKYSMETGRDIKEPEGALTFLHKFEDIFIDGIDPKLSNKYHVAADSPIQWLAIIRPSNYLCKDDGDGNPGNDKVQDSFYALPTSSLTRQQYPGLEINRTADLHTYNSAEAGGQITYNVKITNYSNQEDYLTWLHFDPAKASYTGEAFKGLPVTETVPAGTELVSAEGAEVDGGTLRWTVDLEPGASKTLSYTVKVTAPRGSLIVNRGGFVGNIPSNTLETDVGGKKLTDVDKQKLSAFAATPLNDWVKTYNIGDCTPSQFANKIYQDVLGIDLQLPAEKEFYGKLCKQYHYKMAHGYGQHKEKIYDSWPGTLRTEVDEDFATIKAMMVTGYTGGKKMQYKRPETCINEFRMDYLEPGDIIFHTNISGEINTNTIHKSTEYRVIVVLDNNHIASLNTDGTYVVESGMWAELTIWEAYLYDFFCLLRPTQAYDDIHALKYDKSGETPMAAAKKILQDEPFDTKPLSEENMKKIAAVTPDGWTKEERNINFVVAVYQKIGIDIKTDALDGLTFAGYLTNVFSKTVGTDDRNYLAPRTARDVIDTKYRTAYRMLLPGYYGGRGTVTKDIDGIVKDYKISDLRIGDVVAMGDWAVSYYIVGVYQGDGYFLFNEMDAKKSYFNWTREKLDDAGFAAKLTDSQWRAFYVLRPARGFADINQRT